LDLYIPRKGIARPRPQFPHSWVCERSIYSIPTFGPPTVFSCSRIGRPIKGIYTVNHSQKHECRNWDCS
jgi:hypothetical protein